MKRFIYPLLFWVGCLLIGWFFVGQNYFNWSIFEKVFAQVRVDQNFDQDLKVEGDSSWKLNYQKWPLKAYFDFENQENSAFYEKNRRELKAINSGVSVGEGIDGNGLVFDGTLHQRLEIEPVQESVNLVPNPSFEEGTTGPDGWTYDASTGGSWEWSDMSFSGNKSIKLSGTSNVNGFKSATFSIKKGSYYKLSFYVKKNGSSGNGLLVDFGEVRFEGGGDVVNFSQLSDDWQKKEFYIKSLNLDETYVTVYRYGINGDLYLDEVVVEEVDLNFLNFNDVKLGCGEKINGDNSYGFKLGQNNISYEKILEFTGWRYHGSNNKFNMDGLGNHLIFRADSENLKQVGGKLSIGVASYYSGEYKSVLVGNDQNNLEEIYQINSDGYHNDILIPEKFYSTEKPLYIKIKNTSGGSFRVIDLNYQATLSENYPSNYGYQAINELSIPDKQTISIWVNPNNIPHGEIISRSALGSVGEYKLYFNDGSIKLDFWDSFKVKKILSTSVSANEWTHIAFSYDGSSGRLKLYKNGQVVQFGQTNGGMWTVPHSTQIGASESINNFSGSIDELYFFETDLSDEQIYQLYKKNAPNLEKPKTVNYFSMNECGGPTLYDDNNIKKTASIDLGSAGQTEFGYCYQKDSLWYQSKSGKFGAGLNLDGQDDYVNFNNSFNLGNQSQSLSFYFKTDQTQGTLVSKNNSNNDQLGGVSVYYQDNKLKASIFTDGLKTIDSNLGLADGEWHNVVLTIDRLSKKMSFFIDQNKVGEVDIASGVDGWNWQNACDFVMGAKQNADCSDIGGDYFLGQIDELNIFNFALDQKQITNQFNFNYASLGNNQISRQLADFSFNSKDKLALFLASDVVNDQNLTLTVGQNKFVNREVDDDTVLYLDFDQTDNDYFFDKTGNNLVAKRFVYPVPEANLINNGLGNFSNVNSVDNDLTTKAFDVSGITSGASLSFQSPTKLIIDEVSLYLDDQGDQANYRIEGSLNGSDWTYLGNLETKNFGWNRVTLGNNDYYTHYRLVLNNNPSVVQNVMEVEFKQTVKSVLGKYGQGAEFNGYSNCLELKNKGLFQLPVYTYTAWIKPEEISGNNAIFSNFRMESRDPKKYYGTNFRIGHDGVNFINSLQIVNTSGGAWNRDNNSFKDNVIENSRWQMVNVVFDGSQAKLFLNGVKISQENIPSPSFENDSLEAMIGCMHLNSFVSEIEKGNFFDGIMDEVRIDKVARSEEEIKQLFEIENRRHKIDYQAKLNLKEISLKGVDQPLSLAVDRVDFNESLSNKVGVGDVLIVKEYQDDQEYLIQGIISEVDLTENFVKVESWQVVKNGVPNYTESVCGAGFDYCFTTKAQAFVWRRELIDFLLNKETDFNNLTWEFNGDKGQSLYLDDLRKLENPLGNCDDCLINPELEVRSDPQQYFQYRAFLFTQNPLVSPEFNKVTLTYDAHPETSRLMRHGKYFDNHGRLQPFWFAREPKKE